MALLREKETLLQFEAFEYWRSLSDKSRSLILVSQRFNLPLRDVRRWSRRFGWKDRLREIEGDVADVIRQAAREDVIDTKVLYHTGIRATIRKWFMLHFKDAKSVEETIMAMGVKELKDLIKLDHMLLEDVEVKRALAGIKPEMSIVKQFTDTELRTLIEEIRRRQLPEKAADETEVTVEVVEAEPVSKSASRSGSDTP